MQHRLQRLVGWRGGQGTEALAWSSLLRPNGLGCCSWVGDNEIRFSTTGRQFDTAVMMDCSPCPVQPQLQAAVHDAVRRIAKLRVRAGVRPVLFMSWAYQHKPEMTAPTIRPAQLRSTPTPCR